MTYEEMEKRFEAFLKPNKIIEMSISDVSTSQYNLVRSMMPDIKIQRIVIDLEIRGPNLIDPIKPEKSEDFVSKSVYDTLDDT